MKTLIRFVAVLLPGILILKFMAPNSDYFHQSGTFFMLVMIWLELSDISDKLKK